MRRACPLVLCLLLSASPSLGGGIHVDHDLDAVLGEYTSFRFRKSRHDLRRASPALHEWVALQLIGHVRAGGLALLDPEPELCLAYHAAYPGDLRLAAEELGYAYGDRFSPGTYWRRRGASRDPATMSFSFERGTIVVDLWECRRGVLVWRGIATEALRGRREIDRLQLARTLERLMKRWDEMYGDSLAAVRESAAEPRR